jgi:hypothetical protein
MKISWNGNGMKMKIENGEIMKANESNNNNNENNNGNNK